jgi:FkbM family methyltransferase
VTKRGRFRVATALGSDRYTWAALHGLDRKLVALFENRHGGRFLEIGANDGLQQSNTLALESLYGWRGILIEANPVLAGECARNRPLASVVCAAAGRLASFTRIGDTDLMGATGANDGTTIPMVPLSSILDHLGGPPLDLMSVDVEGGELDLLAGLDLERHGPSYLLIETGAVQDVISAVSTHYELDAQWSHHDYLFARHPDRRR